MWILSYMDLDQILITDFDENNHPYSWKLETRSKRKRICLTILALIAIRLAVAHGNAQIRQEETEALRNLTLEPQIWSERNCYLMMFRKTTRSI